MLSAHAHVSISRVWLGATGRFFLDIIQARVFLDLKDEGRNDSYEHVHCRHRGPECWKNP